MSPAVGAAAAPFNRLFEQTQAMVAGAQALEVRGRLTRVAGLVMEAVGLRLPIGAQVLVQQDEALRVDEGIPAHDPQSRARGRRLSAKRRGERFNAARCLYLGRVAPGGQSPGAARPKDHQTPRNDEE